MVYRPGDASSSFTKSPCEQEGTHTYKALEVMLRVFTDETRHGAKKVGIVLSDGRSKFPDDTVRAADDSKLADVYLISIGVGYRINEGELKAISSNGTAHILSPSTNPNLDEMIAKLACAGNICDNCKFLNGIGYIQHPVHCQLFYQCLKNGKFLVPYLKTCSIGLIWSQESLSCVQRTNRLCPFDVCQKEGVTTYPVYNQCRSYWVCVNKTTSHIKCCPPRHRYNSVSKLCQLDLLCRDTCQLRKTEINKECDRLPHPTTAKKYLKILYKGIWTIEMPCPPGALYNQLDCECSIHDVRPTPDTECRPKIYLPFDKDLKDHSGNELFVTVFGPIFVANISGAQGGGSACFDGKSRIIFPTLAGVSLGRKFVIRYRFLGKDESDNNMNIISNGDCNVTATIKNYMNKRNMSFHSLIRTVDGTSRVSMPYNKSDWNDVEIRYDGQTLKITINGRFVSRALTGKVLKTQTALQIGNSCKKADFFNGYIDEFQYYDCLPK